MNGLELEMNVTEAVPGGTSANGGAANWASANQEYLALEFCRLKETLRSGSQTGGAAPDRGAGTFRADLDAPAMIDRLSEVFGLSPFERDVVLLCAGVEMDSELGALCADLHGQAERTAPSFGLALATLADAHWSALASQSPLRRYRLVEIEVAHGLTAGALRIDERILHYLAGVNLLDPRLEHVVREGAGCEYMAESHRAIAATAASYLMRTPFGGPAVHLLGDDTDGQQDTASEAAQQAGLRLFCLRAEDLPAPGAELDLLVQLWHREALLLSGALLIQSSAGEAGASVRYFAESVSGPLLLCSSESLPLRRPVIRFRVDKPMPKEQKQLWDLAMNGAGDEETTNLLAQHFRFSARTILRTAAASAQRGFERGTDVWSACRMQARPRLEDLASRVTSSAGWDDLILPAPQMEMLHQIVAHMSHRLTVHETWGFAQNGRRGLGVSALFTGESGTGKTLAAEVVSHALSLDLYRVDLAAVVSKYIGESEKNLRRIFDAAEEGGVALLFDEADALFGKRTEVKDSHDRYANIEVGYLLQRLEAFQGLVLLTTNFKASLDRAFQRRLRFTVNFPFPHAAEREEMWRRAFPAQTPTEGLDAGRLAQLHVTGGNIRNIALHAAFLAAQEDAPINMRHVLQAARMEANTMERPLSDAEIRGWV